MLNARKTAVLASERSDWITCSDTRVDALSGIEKVPAWLPALGFAVALLGAGCKDSARDVQTTSIARQSIHAGTVDDPGNPIYPEGRFRVSSGCNGVRATG